MVVLLFMRRLMPTIAAAVTVPLSICGTLGGMWFLGYSLDNFSLMALTISVGFVVDDAIVMIENIFRHMEQGMPPLQAALAGSRQIGFTVISISISLVAVFIPLLFMGGILGRLFHEFAMTLTMAIVDLGGGVAHPHADDLRPVHAHRTSTRRRRRSGAGSTAASSAASRAAARFYARTPRLGAAAPRLMLLVMLATVVFTVRLYGTVPKGFLPDAGHGLADRAPPSPRPDVSFQAMAERQRRWWTCCSPTRRCRAWARTVGVSSGWSSLNRGPDLRQPQAAVANAASSAEAVIARLRAGAVEDRRRADDPVLGPGSARRRPHRRRAVPVRGASARIWTRCAHWTPGCLKTS